MISTIIAPIIAAIRNPNQASCGKTKHVEKPAPQKSAENTRDDRAKHAYFDTGNNLVSDPNSDAADNNCLQ